MLWINGKNFVGTELIVIDKKTDSIADFFGERKYWSVLEDIDNKFEIDLILLLSINYFARIH
jgi:hypothetical protein